MLTLTTVRTGTAALVGAGAVGLRRGLVSAATVARGLKPAAAPHQSSEQEQAWSKTGTWTDKRGRTGHAEVQIVPQRFWDEGGTLMMRSAVTTTLEGTRGSVPQTRTTNLEVRHVTAGVAVNGVSPAYYDTLDLVLGPLDFHLLGVEVHLDQVVLDVVGGPGASNLLGAVAGLLDGSGALGEVADLLNQVLAFLDGHRA
jgi:hypothetical protein